MEEILTKCKNCGSDLKYNIAERSLTCEYCKSKFHMPKAKIDAVLVRGYSNSFHPNQFNKNLSAYKCDMCGHTFFAATQDMASECSSCGCSSCSEINSSGYCADGIIPFELTKDEAAKKFENYLRSKPGISKAFMKEAKNKNIKGVFVPVWNFVFDVDASFSATANEIRKNEQGVYYGVPYPIYGEQSKSIKSADQCATTAEEDDLLELFDEDDYQKIIPYAPEYTLGYKVDDINRNISDYYEKVVDEAKSDFKSQITRSLLLKHKDVGGLQVDTDERDVYFNFTYVPVYVNTFKHKGKVYKTYISGTTGKVAGKRPFSFKTLLKGLAKVLGFIAALVLIYFLFIK